MRICWIAIQAPTAAIIGTAGACRVWTQLGSGQVPIKGRLGAWRRRASVVAGHGAPPSSSACRAWNFSMMLATAFSAMCGAFSYRAKSP